MIKEKMPSHYIKRPQLQRIIDSDEPCETKLQNLRSYLERDPSSSTSNLTVTSPATQPAVEEHANNFEKVLKEINGSSEKKQALSLLHEIGKSSYLSFNSDTLEFILNGETIKFTNVAYLIEKIVTSSASTLPIGLTLFIEGLLHEKIPFSYYKGGDSINIRDNLIKILGTNEASETSTDHVEGNENSQNDYGLKRKRNDESEDDDFADEPKKQKLSKEGGNDDAVGSDDLQEAIPKRTFNIPEKKILGLRRSPRLLQGIADAWETNNGKKH